MRRIWFVGQLLTDFGRLVLEVLGGA